MVDILRGICTLAQIEIHNCRKYADTDTDTRSAEATDQARPRPHLADVHAGYILKYELA